MGPQDVIVTGTFDNWSGALPLVRTSSGAFELTLPLSLTQLENDQLVFKFIVDGQWVTSPDYKSIQDEHGNSNNILSVTELSSTQASTNQASAKIPEAGGLAVPLQKSSKGDFNTTVLPSEEGKQETLGEPGVFVPSNPHEIDAFNKVSNVDAKELNYKLNQKKKKEEEPKLNDENKAEDEFKPTVMPSTEGQQKTLGEPGVVIPKDAHSISAFNEISTVDPVELNAKLNSKTVKTEEPVKAPIIISAESEGEQIKIREVVKKNKVTGEETVIHREEVKDTEHGTNSTITSTEELPKTSDTNTETEEPIATTSSKVTSSTPVDKQGKRGFFKKFKSIIK
ncbi:hypothetical protein WICPIJ_008474 [Wickerhamomyces pijperi]|uniref:AMP-activated protein kinase glycogen-binding domain-containing protein n=1 Tax=Wickerhamomyces pijperi TaxID=599730 RepID=A0A9P8THP9_WICPI|nr:hypothetical protein WICPIJ_008474 [Wickerhamomyces pijperi]